MKIVESQEEGEPNGKPKREHPLWETIVMAGSFVLLWAWFLARQVSLRAPGTKMWPGWTVLQVAAVVVLVVVLVRRMARVRRALREGSQLPNQLFGMNGRGMNGAGMNGSRMNGTGKNGTGKSGIGKRR